MAAFYLPSFSSKGANFLSSLYQTPLQIQCQLMSRLCFLIALVSALEFYKRVFRAYMGFLFMGCFSTLKAVFTGSCDFGSGFFVFGCVAKIWEVLVVLFMFFLGFKVLQFGGNCEIRKGVSPICDEFDCGKKLGLEEEENKEFCDEDKLFDLMLLRKMVKFEREKADLINCELEKERMAASSAADEAMSMILRLQNEKSSLLMQVNQLQRLFEEKQLYDQYLIHSLQWIILKHESERILLEDQLRMCTEKLGVYVNASEDSANFDKVFSTTARSLSNGSRFRDLFVKSLDFDSSPI